MFDYLPCPGHALSWHGMPWPTAEEEVSPQENLCMLRFMENIDPSLPQIHLGVVIYATCLLGGQIRNWPWLTETKTPSAP